MCYLLRRLGRTSKVRNTKFNPILANFSNSYSLRKPKKFCFAGIFQGYKMGILARNGLKDLNDNFNAFPLFLEMPRNSVNLTLIFYWFTSRHLKESYRERFSLSFIHWLMLFCCLYFYLWTDFTHWCSVSIFDFERGNAGWAVTP